MSVSSLYLYIKRLAKTFLCTVYDNKYVLKLMHKCLFKLILKTLVCATMDRGQRRKVENGFITSIYVQSCMMIYNQFF